LGRIARHPLGLGRDAAEDRLTEVFAAVLEHPACAGLAQFVTSGWVNAALKFHASDAILGLSQLLGELQAHDWLCDVETQVSITVEGQRRRPDLQMRFSRADARDILVCVEVKRGTRPHTKQLEAYAKHLERQVHATALVVLVAPRASYPFPEHEVPSYVPQLSWEETARILGDYQPTSEASELLVRELRNYLNEEGLMDPERVTPEHLVAITHHQAAFKALAQVYEIADEVICRNRTAPPPEHSASPIFRSS
jgi:hypothetical protein